MSGLSQVCRVYMWRATADTIADIDRILDRYLVSLFLYVWTIITSCELDLTYLWLWVICKPIPLIYKVCSQVNPNCCPNIYHSVQAVVSSQLKWIFNLGLLHTIGPTTHQRQVGFTEESGSTVFRTVPWTAKRLNSTSCLYNHDLVVFFKAKTYLFMDRIQKYSFITLSCAWYYQIYMSTCAFSNQALLTC